MKVSSSKSSEPIVSVYRYNKDTDSSDLVASSKKKHPDFKGDTVAADTFKAAMMVTDYFKGTHGWKGYGGKGEELKLVVGYAPFVQPVNNAFWDEGKKELVFGDGDGKIFSPLGTAPDVVAHEFMHGVISSRVKLDYRGESGGIHESFADVLATGVDGNLQIGETVYTPGYDGDALRDLGHLRYTHVDLLPSHGDKYHGEPHIMGEPLSHAAYLASQKVGMNKVRDVWFKAVTEHMKDDSDYMGARDAVLGAASSLYGSSDKSIKAFEDAFNAVGILKKGK